jgi:hypothetical protein
MTAPRDVAFACVCGKLAGTVRGLSPGAGTHAECHCASCRAAEIYCHRPDPGQEGVGIFQTTPDRIEITQGAEHLAVFSFGPKNILRWYAGCCDMPLFNTTRSPKFSFVGIRTNCLSGTAALGPVVGHAFVPKPDGGTRHEGFLRFLTGTLARVARQRLSGRWRVTPFFDPETGEPTRPVHVIPKAERDALKARAEPSQPS